MKIKPFYPLSVVVKVRDGNKEEQMLIQSRRYIKPTGEEKQWVYDGIFIIIHNGLVSFSTTITCLPEDSIIKVLTPVHKIE